MAEWIAVIHFSPAVVEKLWYKHHLVPDQVRQAISFGHGHNAVWHDHPLYGRRLLVHGFLPSGQEIKVVLKPADRSDGDWICKTAMRRALP